ncbi:GNAT family N-acetyltransferase [Natronoglycomyces albus]|uniref:GNAT family N-acetyltransferase n=1 Tax=Natronoglycomyces albus TaxID=2811108 RepID=A0A895XKX4_9ACTN|nr:GNAT family N-acetyltransferase [Natronoglycomyces albus]QSB06371.1 GNAT family N-acetyltransferase [Natronoglycomyces albus]
MTTNPTTNIDTYPSSGLVVRPAEPGDYAAIAEVVTQAYRAVGQLEGTASFYEQELRDVAGRVEKAEVIVAVDATSNDVLGSVTICPVDSPLSELAQPGELEFRMLAVSTSAQRRGVGRALVQAVCDRARELDCHQLVIYVRTAVAAEAVALYEKLGFETMPERDWMPIPTVTLHAYRLRL